MSYGRACGLGCASCGGACNVSSLGASPLTTAFRQLAQDAARRPALAPVTGTRPASPAPVITIPFRPTTSPAPTTTAAPRPTAPPALTIPRVTAPTVNTGPIYQAAQQAAQQGDGDTAAALASTAQQLDLTPTPPVPAVTVTPSAPPGAPDATAGLIVIAGGLVAILFLLRSR